MKPLEIACNHLGCGAQAGEECKWKMFGTGVFFTSPHPHSERVEDAAAMGEPGVSKEAFDKAVIGSGEIF